jgi:acetyl esterase/lipase
VLVAGLVIGSATVAVGGGVGPVGPGPAPATAATRYLDPIFLPDVQRDVLYGTAVSQQGELVELRLDLYTPRGDTADDRPVFLFAHGGFFVTGDKSGAVVWAQRMAQRGYVAASINYRLDTQAVVAPVDTPREERAVNDARADMQTAVRWFRKHADELRIDPDRIAVGGTSAGAVTALGVAANADAPLPGDHDEYSSAVCTAVSFSGANDPAAIGPLDAGAIFHHGEIDTVVPTAQAAATRDAMSAAGLPVAWYEYPGEGHDLSDASIQARIQPTIRWLYDRVATAPYPCSPAVAQLAPVLPGRQTPITGEAERSGVVSLVSVSNRAPGYVQALPCGATPGGSSNLNADAPQQIRAVLAVVRFGADGRACLFNQVGTHLVADLQGWFAPGAFDDVVDDRLIDTRSGPRPPNGGVVELRGRPDSTGVVSLVVTETTGAGYLQVLPCGATPGGSSNLNADAAGQTRAGLALVRFGADGRACVFVQRSAHVVADLQGYLDAGAVDDVIDDRLLDTRRGARPGDASLTELRGRPDSTAVVSLVATETTAPGYVQVLPCGATPGGSSNLNADASGQTVAGLAFVRFGADGRVCVFAQRSTHLVADLQGYLTDGAFVDVPDRRLLDTRTR